MKYMGSKRRVAAHILPVMLGEAKNHGITKWVEPFVGGGNMIDRVPGIFERIGCDLNPHTIRAMIDIRDIAGSLPDSVSESEYNAMRGTPPASVTSWVRFGASFGGKFEAGYARGKSSSGDWRNYVAESKRNALQQQPRLQGVKLIYGDYRDIQTDNSLIYCDPPYQNASGYKTGRFGHAEFFEWCRKMARNNIVFVSEYSAPCDFDEVWSGEQKTNFSSTRKEATHNATERLFMVRRSL